MRIILLSVLLVFLVDAKLLKLGDVVTMVATNNNVVIVNDQELTKNIVISGRPYFSVNDLVGVLNAYGLDLRNYGTYYQIIKKGIQRKVFNTKNKQVMDLAHAYGCDISGDWVVCDLDGVKGHELQFMIQSLENAYREKNTKWLKIERSSNHGKTD